MLPLLFGTTGRELYGVFHAAVSPGHVGRGVVFCSPMPHEGLAAYRAFRLLADSLARERVHCLRFDYLATGDSAGESQDLNIAAHVDDIGAAIDELKALSGVRVVHLIGLRLGALLALEAAKARDDVAGVIAWEPILHGRAYRSELMENASPFSRSYWEIDGLVIADHNLDKISALTLPAVLQGVSCPVGLIVSTNHPEFEAMRPMIERGDLMCRSEIVEDALPWKADSIIGAAPIPAQATRVIKSWLTDLI
jgi:pimeloyl-ACP methyl ester carboxylesterase